MKSRRIVLPAAILALTTCLSWAADEAKRKIIIDQDAAGPAGTDQQSMLVLIQSPKTDVLGITVVTGDQWLKAEVAHTLRMLELIRRTDIPVAAGAEYPLVRSKAETEMWEQRFGTVQWLGAWTPKLYTPPTTSGPCPKASQPPNPSTRMRALPGPHGAQVSARGHHLRRRPHDEPGAGDFHRP